MEVRAPLGGAGVRVELPLGPLAGDIVAALEPEGARIHLDGAARDGDDGGELGLDLMPDA